MEFYDFPYIGNLIIPTDELIFFFRGVGIPPTSTKLKEKVILGLGLNMASDQGLFNHPTRLSVGRSNDL